MVSYLKAAGVTTIHKMVATHPHEDHIGGLIAVMDNFKVEHVYDSGFAHTTQVFERYLTKIDQIGADFTVARRGDKISLDPAVDITVIHPASLGNNINDNSVSLKIKYGDITFITTGDAETNAERAMTSSGINLNAQILKVGHHGSSTSSTAAFLDAVQPEIAIIMVGEGNRYGHPTEQTLNALARRGIDVYRTDKQGNIVVTTNGLTYSVNTPPDPAMVAIRQELAPTPTPTPTPAPTPEPTPEPAPARTPTPAPTPSQPSATGSVNINTASLEELMTIIHIDQTRGQEMLQIRPFRSVDDVNNPPLMP